MLCVTLSKSVCHFVGDIWIEKVWQEWHTLYHQEILKFDLFLLNDKPGVLKYINILSHEWYTNSIRLAPTWHFFLNNLLIENNLVFVFNVKAGKKEENSLNKCWNVHKNYAA